MGEKGHDYPGEAWEQRLCPFFMKSKDKEAAILFRVSLPGLLRAGP